MKIWGTDGQANLLFSRGVLYCRTVNKIASQLPLDEALGWLTGVKPANNAIVRLETAFGGGKTHNLIALDHAAAGYAPGPEFVSNARAI